MYIFVHLCCYLKAGWDNGGRDRSKTFAYLPNVSHAFPKRHKRRRGVCCEQLVCVPCPKKLTISAPCGDEIGSIGNFRDAEFYGFVSKDNFCWDAPSWRKNILNRTSLCSATWGDITICNREASLSFSLAWHNTPGCLTNKQQLVNLWFVSLCICCSHLVMSSPSLSQKTFRITTRVEDASVGGQEQGGHCYISPHFKFTSSKWRSSIDRTDSGTDSALSEK